MLRWAIKEATHCLGCGVWFTPLFGRIVRCPPCREAFNKNRQKEYAKAKLPPPRKQPKEIECVICRTSFKAFYGKYCSQKCRIQAACERRYNKPKTRVCQFCAETFTCLYGCKRQTFCSKTCARRSARKVRGHDSTRKRARRFGCLIEPVNPRKVFERDKWRCRMCFCETPKELRGSKEPNAPELDHIWPLSKKGPHTYKNTQCLCRSCNSKKGNSLTFAIEKKALESNVRVYWNSEQSQGETRCG